MLTDVLTWKHEKIRFSTAMIYDHVIKGNGNISYPGL